MKYKTEKKLKAIDFFCGAGGLTRGFLDAQIDVVLGIDSDIQCKQTYETNNHVPFFSCDINKLSIDELYSKCNAENFDDYVFAGCAPCQPFSTQNKGINKSSNATLLGIFGNVVQATEPGYIVIENVPGIRRVKGYSTFKRFLSLLNNMHYFYAYDVLNAKNFGVPQNRNRLLLIASKYYPPSLPLGKFDGSKIPFITVHDAISHFPSIRAGERHPLIPNHDAASLSPLNLRRITSTPPNGGSRESWPDELKLKCHSGNYTGHSDVYGRMRWEFPAPTLTGKCNSITNGRYAHPEQNRGITLREAAALQTFPDRYVFFGSNKAIAQQIGNAVPVKLAEQIGKHIRLSSRK